MCWRNTSYNNRGAFNKKWLMISVQRETQPRPEFQFLMISGRYYYCRVGSVRAIPLLYGSVGNSEGLDAGLGTHIEDTAEQMARRPLLLLSTPTLPFHNTGLFTPRILQCYYVVTQNLTFSSILSILFTTVTVVV